MARRYYDLIASLPHLPHFEQAERVPINRVRLQQRRGMLDADDAAQLERAWPVIAWQLQPVTRTDAEVVKRYESVMEHTSNATLRELIELRMGQRTVVAAMRRRRRGMGPPAEDEAWGVTRFRRLVIARWDVPDFGLRALFPWLPEAERRLEAKDAIGLERLIMNALWDRLCRIGEAHPFQFEEVFAYFFRWDVLDRWLSYDAEAARARFEELIAEVIGEHSQPFG